MQTDIHADKLLILDFGSQYTQLIARRVRECGVYSEIHPWDMSDEDITAFGPRGIVLSGGPESVNLDDPPKVSHSIFELGVPVLGICYGMQTMVAELGGKVEASIHREFGYAEISPGDSSLFGDLSDSDDEPLLKVWMSHGDRVESLPPGFKATASSRNSPLAAMEDSTRHFYGVQFHPEVTHTLQGQEIIRRFVSDVCLCAGDWTPGNIVRDAIDTVREQVGDGKVLLGLSGGVDSSVVAALLHEAIGDQLTCVFVDHGLLRHNEGDKVMQLFADHLGVNVVRVHAAERFFRALDGVADPEEKRKIIGGQFIEVFEEEAAKLEDVHWLAQGTIYPDVIESAGAKTGKAHVIKSHHNVGGLPEYMRMSLVEPLRELFKDEVRRIGLELGLPREMVFRHPFPGPGLGVRVLGEVKRHFVEKLQYADDIFIDELYKHGLYDKTSQAFAVFLPVRSVGVMGDGRRYDYVIALRAVETIDFMTARWARLPYEFLEHVSLRIINEVDGISRVTYDISGKPPATIEWEVFDDLECGKQTIRSSEFDGCTFTACDFSEAEIVDCKFSDCVFRGSNLNVVKLDGTKFADTEFRDCKVTGVNWTSLNWSSIALSAPFLFDACDISFSVFESLKLPELEITRCKAHDVDFSECDLTDADFYETDLTNARFNLSRLDRCNFREASNYAIDPLKNSVEGASFSVPDVLSLLSPFGISIEDHD